MERKQAGGPLTRLIVCAVAAAVVVYAVEKLCDGKDIPLWESYGDKVKENKTQAIAVVAVALYGLSLAIWPEERTLSEAEQENDFTPCG